MHGSLIAFISLVAAASAQYNQTRNLTPDGYWHNRYFGILSQSSFGDYNTLCPNQTFTEEEMRSNFPDSDLPPWELIEVFGPTPSGGEGFAAVVPEMNKVVVVFKGNPQIEANLPLDVVSWSVIPGMNGTCDECTANAAAVQAYLEIKEETNDFEATLARYAGAGLVYATTGLGFGGMLSLLHAVDFNRHDAWYSHTQGTPRTFNQAGVDFYNLRFNGEAGERGVWGNDQMVNLIPASDDYAHAGTAFRYYGVNATSNQPNWNICWPDLDPLATACEPSGQFVDGITPSPLQDHYFSWTNVGQCGPPARDYEVINSFITENYPANFSIAGYYNLAQDLPMPVENMRGGSANYGGEFATQSEAALQARATGQCSKFNVNACL